MNKLLYVRQNKVASYPSEVDGFCPSIRYPEYRYEQLSTEANSVYDMVRSSLEHLGMDQEHYNTPSWNPLGDIIKKGDSVLIKPNFVKHCNPSGGMDCLVTNASVLRAIIDYALIALDGTGSITVGDAPVQTCDFEALVVAAHYDKVVGFFRASGVLINFVDFRGTVATRGKHGKLHQEINEEKHNASVIVNMGIDSTFYNSSNEKRLRITNYASDDLYIHHHGNIHEYLISRSVLEADVIINLPKPKTHRKAGVTGALKNMVGINVEKNYLPHHKQGGKDEGGDEYPKKNFLFHWQSMLNDKIDFANSRDRSGSAVFWTAVLDCVLAVQKCLGLKKYGTFSEGSWAGNDTIWRTVCDLNRILLYADKNGLLCDTKQRKMFTLADMIVIGENEGPLSPTPRFMGILVSGMNSLDIDKLIVKLLGLDIDSIPSVSKATFGERYYLRSDDCRIESNNPDIQVDSVENLDSKKFEHVIMPSGWRTV